MLKVNRVSKHFGADPVLEDVSFTLTPGERAGLVGPNGSGKSTLLRLIAREMAPDAGTVWTDPAERVAYLPQYPQDELHLTVRAALLRGAGRAGQVAERLAELERTMGQAGQNLPRLVAEYGELREQFERLDGYALESRLQRVMDGLGLAAGEGQTVAELSGGTKTKLSLARLLLYDADILLLDEPTNYLDLAALLWLERYVAEAPQSCIIVSHDRRFLDRTVSSILELDGASHRLRQWPGTYSDYAEARARERETQQQEYLDQQAEQRRIREDIRRTREQARSNDRKSQDDYKGKYDRHRKAYDRAMAGTTARKARVRERKLERLLESPDRLEKPKVGWNLHLVDLTRTAIDDNRMILEAEGVTAGYGGPPVLRDLSLRLYGRDRVALLGVNGSGKSSLLRCITGSLPHGGRIRLGPSVRPGFLSQEAEELPLDATVLALFRARTEMSESEARSYLHRLLFTGQEVFKPVRVLSYGQRAKLALGLLVLSAANFLLLDEPTSHMDMPALEAIEEALAAYAGPLLVVSHDRYFLERIGINRVEVLEDGRLHSVNGLEDYEAELLRAGDGNGSAAQR